MLDYLLKRPMLLCGAMCCAVSVVGYYFRPFLLIFGIITVILLAYMYLTQARAALIFAFSLLLVMTLNTIFVFGKAERLALLAGEEYSCELVVCDITHRDNGYVRADIEIKDSKAAVDGQRLSVFSSYTQLKKGYYYTADIKLTEIKSEYRLSNYSKGIYLNGSMYNTEPSQRSPDFVLTAADKATDYISNLFFENLDYSEASTLCALLYGDRAGFSDSFYENVKNSGVSHVMVVSGMHLSILVSSLTAVTERLLYNRYLKALLMVIVVLLLTTVCGFTMSMLRAGVMYAISAIGLILGRKGVTENTLGAATAVILLFSPFAVFNVAFQLSLLSTLGIVAVAVPVTEYFSSQGIIKSKALLYIVSSLTATLSAMLLTLPVSVYVFGSVSYVAPLTNLLIAPFVTYILCFALAALLLSLVWRLGAAVLFVPCEGLLKYINYVINRLGSPDYTVKLGAGYAAVSLLPIAAIFAILLLFRRKRNIKRLKQLQNKIIKEGGGALKWQQYSKKP